MTTAYSYIRFSSAVQAKGDSLRRQTQLTLEYCNRHSLTLSEQSFVDLGVSAFHSANSHEDSGLGQFLKALEQGVIPRGSFLLVESLDRLSRAKVQTALRQLLNIIDYDITVVTLLDGRTYNSDSNTTDLIISLTVMERAHNESKTKSERLKAVWANKRANPHTTTRHSNTPFWLSLNEDKRTYTVIESKADIVRRIFQMSIDGRGAVSTCRILNEEGIKAPRGGTWALTSIKKILGSKAAIGHHTHIINNKVQSSTVPDFYPPIINEETYYLSQAKMKERHKPNSAGRKSTFPNVLSQVAVCGSCGSHMLYDPKSPQWIYLTCREFKKNACTNKPLRIELINRFIIEQYLHPQHFEKHVELVKKSSTSADQTTVLEGKIESAKEALKQLLTLSSDFSNSVIQDEIKTRSESIRSLETQLEEAKALSVESVTSIHMDFFESCQLVADALQLEVYGKQPAPLSKEELFKVRVKLNRSLKQTFSEITVSHCPDTKKASLTANGFMFEAHKSAMKTGFNDTTWWII
ncbi:recombinase family protein [Vibrio amylolyticus]|uniref:recombinase family protein n=1 Tax=Vibrio TaxID=662 RepID=UPI000C854C05|nr:recombinase family protein [Vibrio sp. 10N.261.55.A7]PMJ91969.1 site-specific recombinase [Vibrio sp. 10N.261.55.A7]